MKRILLLSFILFWFASPAVGAGYAPPENTPMIRVAVLKDASSLTVYIRGKYKIYDGQSGFEIRSGRRLKKAVIRSSEYGMTLGNEEFQSDNLRFEMQKDITLVVNDRKLRFRGWLDVIKKSNNRFLVINTLDLESYVRGVLYHEVSHRWPMEAMKAQAVAARTYALFQTRENFDQPFDVTSDIYSQVYGGRSAERYRTNIAVKRTNAEILIFNGDVLPAYFHANSGGYTEDVSEMWEHDLFPLKGLADNYSVGTPNYRWKKNFRSKDVQKRLNKSGYKLGLIKEIKVLERNKSGRIRNLAIVTRDGKQTVISGKRFRNIIGPNLVKSNNYEIVMKGYYFDLTGNGWGHGVGMSQWGAYNMAKQDRFVYDSILSFYYPGAQIMDYREIELPPLEEQETVTVKHAGSQ